MKNPKKDNYWGTSVKRYVTDGEDNYREEGFLYLNIRDCKDIEKIIDTVSHELEHLVLPEVREKIMTELQEKFELI